MLGFRLTKVLSSETGGCVRTGGHRKRLVSWHDASYLTITRSSLPPGPHTAVPHVSSITYPSTPPQKDGAAHQITRASFTSDMDNVPGEIQEAIGSDDTDKLLKLLRVHPERSYEELQDSLTIAISTGSLRTIEFLLNHGATLKYSSYDELFIREEPAIFKQLIDHGWDINSTEFERPPVQ